MSYWHHRRCAKPHKAAATTQLAQKLKAGRQSATTTSQPGTH